MNNIVNCKESTQAAPIFMLDGMPVFRGQTLYHRDVRLTGGKVKAEFRPEGGFVTVRTLNGAVPTVLVSDLLWEQHPEDVMRKDFMDSQRRCGIYHTTERDFEMWMLGRKSVI